jgi:6-phosphogluconate dehydrogenase
VRPFPEGIGSEGTGSEGTGSERTSSEGIGSEEISSEEISDVGADARSGVIADLHDALYASKVVSYAQGFMLMRAASDLHGWGLDLGRIASLWRAGCIIRSRFLDDITTAFETGPDLPSLVLDPFFAGELSGAEPGWRRTVMRAVGHGIPVPAYAAALAFSDAYRSDRLPANLIQAQRDYFGAHTYERVDGPRGSWFHTNWTGTGGSTSSGTYEA